MKRLFLISFISAFAIAYQEDKLLDMIQTYSLKCSKSDANACEKLE